MTKTPNEGSAPFVLAGRNAVIEAINSDKTVNRLFVKKGEIEGSLKMIVAKAKDKGIVITFVPKEKLDELSENARHQGVIAFCPPYDYADLGDVLSDIAKKSQQPFLIILDKIFDPHNFGAIIRTALACAAHAIIIPKRRSVGITPAVVSASAGAVEHLPICRVSNISQTIEHLKSQNIWTVGADAGGATIYASPAPFDGPTALVIGNENEGISRLVKEKCDFLVSLPMHGPIPSLNASVAAAVCMYEVLRRRL